MHLNDIIKNLYRVLLLLAFSTCSQAAENSDRQLIFGVHPYLHPSILVERFTPLTEYLGKQLDKKILIRVGKNYHDHIEAIEQGKVDFAFMGPSLFIKLTQQNDQFKALGRLSFSGRNSFRGAIIARQNSSLQSLTDLKGKRFAFGDPESTLSSLLPIRMLNDAGIQLDDLSTYSNLKNHHNVALAVLLGKYDAGGVKEEIFNEYKSRGLKVLQWSIDIPTHLFVAREGLPDKEINALKKLLQNLHNHPEANNILQNIKKGTTAIIPAKLEEYAELRKLISPLQNTTLQIETGN